MALPRRLDHGAPPDGRIPLALGLLVIAAVLAGVAAPVGVAVVGQTTLGWLVLTGALTVGYVACALCVFFAPDGDLRRGAPTAGAAGTAALVVFLIVGGEGLFFVPAFVLWTTVAVRRHHLVGGSTWELLLAGSIGASIAMAALNLILLLPHPQ